MGQRFSRTQLHLLVAAASFGAVGVALVTQYQYDMQPCPWCVLQRLIFVAIGAVALLGLAWRSWGGKRAVPLLLLLLCGAGSASCKLTLADRIVSGLRLDALLPSVFEARANCADAAVALAGIPYEFWSLALFFVIEAVALVLFIGGRKTA
jgi:protein dithiol:quinone oxidoreductase